MTEKKRTTQQNRALHKWFALLAEQLNLAGYDIKKTLSQNIEHPWTPTLIKELLFRPTMKSYMSKLSTTKLTTKEIDPILDVITKYLGENLGLDCPPFPSIDQLMLEEDKYYE